MDVPFVSRDVCLAVPGEPGPGGLLPDFDPAKWERFGIKGGGIQIRHDDETLKDFLAPVKRVPGMAESSVSYRIVTEHHARMAKPKKLTGPIQFVLKLLGFWSLERDDAVGLLGFGQADAAYVDATLDGIEHFRGRDVRDRIAYLFRIRETLRVLFRDLEVENEWLREPHSLLDDQSPLSLLLDGSMEDLLLVKEYVDTVAGR